MQEVFSQITHLFSKLTKVHKVGIGACLCGLIIFVWTHTAQYIPLRLSDDPSETATMKRDFDLKGIPYKEKHGRLWVLKDHSSQIEVDRSRPVERSKGFELFDTNTWIKGEKELHILEMRALKGQLERELLEFEQIKHASVILDLAVPRSFGAPVEPTKASVILELKPHVRLGHAPLRAITHHLTGAVRGLEPYRVAISDTKGHIYQMISSAEGESSEALMHSEMKEYIELMLERICGGGHVSMTWRRGPPMAVDVMIDQSVVSASILSEISEKIQSIAARYGVELVSSFDVLPFARQAPDAVYLPHQGSLGMVFYMLMVCVTMAALFLLTQKIRKKTPLSLKEGEERGARIDFQVLAASLQGDDPKTLALMFSYLEAQRAEEILAAFPKELQEAILVEMENVP